MSSTLSINRPAGIAITDVCVLAAVYFIPAFSHSTGFPLYNFEPMRLLLFAAYLLRGNLSNAIFLAITLPLVSSIFPPHHPPFYKALIMSLELVVNLLSFVWLLKISKWPPFIIFFISTIASKVFYYGLKYVFIQMGLIEGQLITTSLLTQLIILTCLSLLYGIFYKQQKG